MTDDEALDRIRARLDGARSSLEAAAARDEALAEYVPAQRRLLVFTKEAVMVPRGRVWRLGVFLLGRDGTLYQTGSLTRRQAPGRPAYQSVSAEERRAYRAAAFRGHFAEGESVNYGAHEIALEAESLRSSTGPLFLRDGEALVRWSSTAPDAVVEFGRYLDDRVGLLTNPPAGT